MAFEGFGLGRVEAKSWGRTRRALEGSLWLPGREELVEVVSLTGSRVGWDRRPFVPASAAFCNTRLGRESLILCCRALFHALALDPFSELPALAEPM